MSARLRGALILPALLARVRALLRRTSNHSSSDDAIPPGGLRIDVAARRVFSGTDEVPLTGKEFEVLISPATLIATAPPASTGG